jgi:hypothetical protein
LETNFKIFHFVVAFVQLSEQFFTTIPKLLTTGYMISVRQLTALSLPELTNIHDSCIAAVVSVTAV